mmetsp:Transcript_29715/g.79840  ORF Transcript_29715/g.79840 Transcript_29715/m.79840 type:complete len:126 (-) Transcript_29715:237-614(-)
MAKFVSELTNAFTQFHRSVRLMTHWNPEHIPANACFQAYRPISPSSQPAASLPPMEEKKLYDVAYFCRDKARSRTTAYPENLGGLSNRHPLTKSRAKNPSPDTPAHLHKQGVGNKLGKVLSILNK